MRGLGLVVGALAVAAGCATSAVVPASALLECSVAGAPAEWRQVTADGLAFCVPADWRSTGSQSWRGSGGQVRWGWGPRVREIRSAVIVTRGAPPTRLQAEAALPVAPVQRTTETVGDELVDLWIGEVEGGFRTGADWQTGRTLFMMGEAVSRSAAEQQLDIYRTARLVSR